MASLRFYGKQCVMSVAMTLLVGFIATGPAIAADDCTRPPGGKVDVPKTINFALNSTEISDEDKKQLVEIAQRNAGNPNIEVCLIGMTDRSGSEEYNKKLAMERAEAVEKVLAKLAAEAADPEVNLMPTLIEASHAYATLGEMMGTMAGVFGRHVEVPTI